MKTKIYEELLTKSNNLFYINRYLKFLDLCIQQNKNKELKLSKHHILPKADDMFPQYINLKENPWNLAKLTHRQHYIAHWMIAKIFPDVLSQTYTAMKFFKGDNSRMFEIFSIRKNKLHSENMKGDKNHFFGRTHSEETISRIMQTKNNKSEEEKLESIRKRKETVSKRSEEEQKEIKDKISNTLLNKSEEEKNESKRKSAETTTYNDSILPKISCLFCRYTVVDSQKHIITKYHNENCKENPNRKELESFHCEFCNNDFKSKSILIQYHGDYCKENPNKLLKPILHCEFCNMDIKGNSTYYQYHGDYCKENPKRLSKPIYKCEYCNFTSESIGNYNRWHGDRCKHKVLENNTPTLYDFCD